MKHPLTEGKGGPRMKHPLKEGGMKQKKGDPLRPPDESDDESMPETAVLPRGSSPTTQLTPVLDAHAHA